MTDDKEVERAKKKAQDKSLEEQENLHDAINALDDPSETRPEADDVTPKKEG